MRIAALLLCLFTLPALAQEDGEDARKRQSEQRAEWMLRWMDGQLKLSDAQKEKVKRIMVESDLESTKVRDKHSARIRELLTPEQRETYDQWQARQRGGGAWGGGGGGAGRGGQGGRRGGFGGGMGGMNALRELNLTPEQEKKIQAIYSKQTQMWTEAWQKQQAGESVNWGKIIRDFRKKTNKQVRALLDDTQKQQFDAINKRYDDMMKAFGLNMGGDEAKEGTKSDVPQTPEARAAELTEQAVRVLQCSSEEEAIFRPLIGKLVDYKVKTQARLEGTRKELKDMATSGATDDALTAKLDALKAAEGEYLRKLGLLEEGVRELLTKRQEVGLIGLGVLRST